MAFSTMKKYLNCVLVTTGSGNTGTSVNTNGNQSDGMGNNKPSKSGLSGKGILISLGRLWRFITVEPLMLCWLLPSCFLFIAVENLALEKVSDHFHFYS